jgi:hypothetical protein
MMKNFARVITYGITLVTLATPAIVFAQTAYVVEDIGSSVGLGTSDLKSTTLNIIQWILGILALVAVTMIIFSVFIAATAGGEERGEKAKRVIVGAIIGLIIVLISWAIVTFVAGTTKNVAS